jgi:uncharacterized membrane protein YqgA involved in biofilm formation
MLATIINCAAVIAGCLIGLIFNRKVKEGASDVIYTAAGLITLVIGMKMALVTGHILYLAMALLMGGLVGYLLKIEEGIHRFGGFLERHFGGKGRKGDDFALGFLNSSVLFCVGAMALVGSFEAGTTGKFDLILTKSVLDGFMAILMTSAMGPGVGFSALPILVYQGGLTLLAGLIKDYVSPLMLDELSAVGGVLVLMVGLNLLALKKIKTANFLPALLFTVVFVLLSPFFTSLGIGI